MSAILEELSAELVLPRYRLLESHEIEEKSPGEQVTVVDREVEKALTVRLSSLIRGSTVVGEEAVSENERLLERLGNEHVWIVDPIDGTSNFVKGSRDFAMMVALLHNGEAVASWILAPATGVLAVAEQGAGAWLDGERVILPEANRQGQGGPALPGVAYSRFLPPDVRTAVELNAGPGELTPPSGAAGIEYPRLLRREIAYVIYWRTLPWDHVPGTLLVREAGGVAARPDGSPYRPTASGGGLLVAGNEEDWRRARAMLSPVQGLSPGI